MPRLHVKAICRPGTTDKEKKAPAITEFWPNPETFSVAQAAYLLGPQQKGCGKSCPKRRLGDGEDTGDDY